MPSPSELMSLLPPAKARALFYERDTRLPEGKWRKKMGPPSVSLSYGARREVLVQIAPQYQEATGAQKMLLLDRVVEVTGYARKYAIRLFNHVPESATQIMRPRLPIYGSAVQEQKTFKCLLEACHVPHTKRATMEYAAVSNRAILWVLWDTGLLVSEVCALNLGDVNLAQGTLHIHGSGSRERAFPLAPEVQQVLTAYLEQYRPRAGKREALDPLFLSEQRARLTRNGFTQLFHRLCARAGLEDRRPTPTMLREMFAISYFYSFYFDMGKVEKNDHRVPFDP